MKGNQRNKICHCGSGKKYKKCHGGNVTADEKSVTAFLEHVQAVNQEKENLKSHGIKISFVVPIDFNGKQVFALGGRIYPHQKQGQTFHEFIIEIGLSELGQKWWEIQESLPTEERHHIAKCRKKYIAFAKGNQSAENKVEDGSYGVAPDGWSKDLLSFCFDVCCLLHTSQMPSHLITRLRKKESYQSARYELAVAAIFARLNYKLKFLDDEDVDQSVKHCEFIATCKETGVKIGVEVKSRERKGVLHSDGEYDQSKALKGDVLQLVNKARKQKPKGLPFIIFVDVNSPKDSTEDLDEKKWVRDIMKSVPNNMPNPSLNQPSEYNAIFFTNYGFHYEADDIATLGDYKCLESHFPETIIPNQSTVLEDVHAGASYYGNVPYIKVI